MAYTTIDKPSDYFETKLWSGNATDDRAISGLDFAPNWVWIKNRTDTNSHAIFDTVRGATKYIESDTTDAEATGATFLKSFTSDGFTLGTAGRVNANSQNYVSWNWKAGTSFTNDASATGIGTIDSTGSVNQTAGFSIVSYTGNATDNVSKPLDSTKACGESLDQDSEIRTFYVGATRAKKTLHLIESNALYRFNI